jgi:HlyD family secretion protein
MARKRRGKVGGIVTAIGIALLVVAFAGTLVFLYFKSKGEPPVVKTQTAQVTDIVKKAVATGKIVPRREVQIKPRVSGIIKKLHVEPGDVVKEGALIAEIKIVPDMAAVTRAEAAVRGAHIAMKHAQSELKRGEGLADKGLISRRDLSELRLDKDLKRADLAAAQEQLRVVREGAARKSDEKANTLVRSTVAGTVLEVPVEVGGSVIESNTFNEGTTIASVADMGDMIFVGNVDEADVGRIELGMEVNIKIGAVEGATFEGKLEHIAPKGQELEGAVQFEIKASLKPKQGTTIRAGYSANAEIVLERREQVLAISESLLKFDGDQTYVEVEVAPGKFERRDLDVGVSDGINIEVKDGVDESTKIKQPDTKAAGKS